MTKRNAKKEKSKTVAIILAVLFSYWTWLYTYKRDAWKFWLGLLLCITLFWTLVVPFIVLGWAIIDTALKPMDYWKNYYKTKTK